MHNSGMSLIFKRLLVGIFKHSLAKQGFDYNADISSVLQYAMQSAAATIVNAKADYVMKNVKRLFKFQALKEITGWKVWKCGGGKVQRYFRRAT